MRITESVVTQCTVAVICDRCKVHIEAGTPAFDAITHIDHRCGYGSVWPDGAQIAADLCERCLQALIGDFCAVQDRDPERIDDVISPPEASIQAAGDDVRTDPRGAVIRDKEATKPAGQVEGKGVTDGIASDRPGPVDPDAVFESVEAKRASGELAEDVTTSPVRYQASTTHLGLLERIDADGAVTVGRFYNGEFHPIETS